MNKSSTPLTVASIRKMRGTLSAAAGWAAKSKIFLSIMDVGLRRLSSIYALGSVVGRPRECAARGDTNTDHAGSKSRYAIEKASSLIGFMAKWLRGVADMRRTSKMSALRGLNKAARLIIAQFSDRAHQEHANNSHAGIKNQNRRSDYAFSAWVVFLFVGMSQSAFSREERTEAKTLWTVGIGPGHSRGYYVTPEEALSALRAYHESTKAESFRITSYYYQVLDFVSCAGTEIEPATAVTINGMQTTRCYQERQVWSNGQIGYVVTQPLDSTTRCPLGWGNSQFGPVINNNIVAYCQRYLADREPDPKPEATTCNPVAITSGRKMETSVDYASGGGLNFTRTYRGDIGEMFSRTKASLQDYATPPSGCYQGMYISKYDVNSYPSEYMPACFPHLNPPSAPPQVILSKADGYTTVFSGAGATPAKPANINESAIQLTDAQGVKTWKVTLEDDSVEIYRADGLLLTKTYRNGQVNTFVYSDASTPTSVAPKPNLMIAQTDAFGKTLQWRYNSGSQMIQMIDPAGGLFDYDYDQWGNLVSVTYPADSMGNRTTKRYHFEDASLTKALTGITDESGFRYATYTYNTAGQVTETKHFAAAGVEVNKHTFTYSYQGRTLVTDPLNTSRTYDYGSILNYDSVTGTSQPCTNCGSGASSKYTYDANRNIASKTDFNGNKTTYQYDLARNLETSRTEASGTPQARTITTSWHTQYRLPLLESTYAGSSAIGTPVQTIAYTYDAAGNQLTKTITDPAANTSRTWAYTYNNFGQILTADGPRTDVSDVTTYAYYTCNTGYQCGQVQSITNSLGQVITYNTYNAHGQPLTIIDANGVVTTLTYDARQRLTSRSVSGETTYFAYWPTGLLKQVTLPNASAINYGYDAAHRLTSITDSDGNTLTYTLDAAGNRTQEVAKDAQGAVVRTHSRVFNALSQLYQDIGAANQTTTYSYDNNGNLSGQTDALNRATSYQYDALNRVSTTIDPLLNSTRYGYDARNQLRQVTDPKGLITTYALNGLGDLTQLQSPDTRTTGHSYDAAGNLQTRTDARGQTTTYQYDALNRLLQQSNADQTLSYQYDQGLNGNGRLTTVSDANHSLAFQYDAQGRVTQKTQTTNSQSKTVSYGYSNGQLTQLTTPSGQVIRYGYSNGKLTSVSVNNQPVLSQVRYAPFGQTEGWTWSNGSLTVRQYNQDGQLTLLDSAGLTTNTYYPDGSIATQARDSSATLNLGTGNTSFANATTSNQLLTTTGALARSYQYDAAGNTLSDGTRSYTYNASGRMNSATTASGTTTYRYNALGQRIHKTNGSAATTFVYDEAGHLLGEYAGNGALIQEIVWLNDIPVATIRTDQGGNSTGVFYIHTDHLNSPTSVTRSTNTNEVIWHWDHDPYGNGIPNEDPDGNGLTLSMNLRFPGQYLDQETGLYYNYFRYYDPSTGRYLESDPIGLDAGQFSTYAYVDGRPLNKIDPSGLGGATNPHPRPTAVTVGVEGCLLFMCAGSNVGDTKTTGEMPLIPELGGTIHICMRTQDPPPDQSCYKDDDKRKNKDHTDMNLGIGKYLGLSLSSDGSLCINIGPGFGSPINKRFGTGTL